MKKCTATVIHQKNRILNVTLNYKCNMINLQYTFDPEKQYGSFHELHNAVLKILKNNGYYTGKFHCFDATIYNIQFLDMDIVETGKIYFDQYLYREAEDEK